MSKKPAADFRKTEQTDPRYAQIDSLSPADSLLLQLNSQIEAVRAIEKSLPRIEAASSAALKAVHKTRGRLIYVGAGTSGRLGIQDGVELTPTFNWPPERCLYLMAGGLRAVFRSVEGAEDSALQGRRRMKLLRPAKDDVVIGIAASGTTPFTIAALKTARAAGAVTIGIANNLEGPLLDACEFPIGLDTGAEVISGSTRLKSGTTQKIVLNMLSNQIMIGLNKVCDGQMVDMRATNDKLRARAVRMVRHFADCSPLEAQAALSRCGNAVKPAVLVALGQTPKQAARLLERHDDSLRNALSMIRPAAFSPAA